MVSVIHMRTTIIAPKTVSVGTENVVGMKTAYRVPKTVNVVGKKIAIKMVCVNTSDMNAVKKTNTQVISNVVLGFTDATPVFHVGVFIIQVMWANRLGS